MEIYKRRRPKSLDQMIGCDETAMSLKNMIERDTLPHTILFSGPSGCGKTTLARIVKDALDCNDMDFREMNSASYRGIDSIRDIQRTMNLAPCAGPVRVYLMDEVHMLSKDAQNAALKMLEDTPSCMYFFLCTTEPDKLIKAIQTRCTPMPVRSLTYKEVMTLLERVARKEKLTISDKTKDLIAGACQGSARTALVMLEKVSLLDETQQEAAIDQAQMEQNEAIDLCRLLINKNTSWKQVSTVLANLKGEPENIRYSVLGYARAVLLKTGEHRAYLVIDCFKNNFYDSKSAGLAHACFEVLNSK